MGTYYQLIKGDYLQRSRSYGFLITMIITAYFAYTFLPAETANYHTVRVGNFVGQMNSAWIGHVTAMMSSTFLWMIGYYLINNSIRRDIETGVGQIAATSLAGNFKYLLGKAMGNFFVLLTLAGIALMAGVFQLLLRGNGEVFDPLQFFAPFLFVTLPSILFVSILAIVLEVMLKRYYNLQNIIFFIFLMVFLGMAAKHEGEIYTLVDVLGTKYLSTGITEAVHRVSPATLETASVGFQIGLKHRIHFFSFQGTRWSAIFLLSRLMWTAFAFLLLLLSAKLFHRFDLKPEGGSSSSSKKQHAAPQQTVQELQLGLLPVAEKDFSIWPLLKIELLMLFRKGPRWFWFLNLAGFVALSFMPLDIAHQFGLPLIWFLQLNRWSDIATKERLYRTQYFTYAAYKPLGRLLTAQVLAGLILAIVLSAPLLFRYMVVANLQAVCAIIVAAFFLIGLSISLGIVSGSERLFTVLFFMLSYANLSLVPYTDYLGAINKNMAVTLGVAGFAAVLYLVSYLYRSYEIGHQ